MTNAELELYYSNLLIIQYNSQPKAFATVNVNAKMLNIFELARLVENGYNIDTAIGVQLDILAKYIGVDRTVYGTAFTRDYFGYIEYGVTPPVTGISGYSEYSVPVPDVQFRTYQESNQSIYSLTDEELRTVIKLKRAINSSNSSMKFLDDNILDFFNGKVIFTDNMNMTISYIFEESIAKLVSIALSEGLIIKPTGVGLIIAYTPDIGNIFGFERYGSTAPAYVEGFKKYGVAKIGGWLKYA